MLINLKRELSLVALLALASCQSGGVPSAGSTVPGFKISSVTVEPMAERHLCSALGGAGAAPTITIKHSKVAGAPIKVSMIDNVSSGSLIDHRSTSVSSDASGTTVLRYEFLPPCNTTNRTSSSYSFIVSSGDDSKQILFGKYDSPTKKIMR